MLRAWRWGLSLLVWVAAGCGQAPAAGGTSASAPAASVPPPTMPATGSAVPTPDAAASVVVQRGDAAHSGTYPFPAIRARPQVIWTTALSNLYLGTPLVAGGLLYSGGSDGALYALEAETGAVAWSAPHFEAIESGLAIAGELIVAAGQNQRVMALNRHSG